MVQVLQLNNTTIKTPSVGNFGIEKYVLTKAGRVANGDMTMDKIADKRKFTLKYDVLSGIEYDKILNVTDNNTFFTVSYVENSVSKSALCYAGAIKAIQFRTDPWYWTDITVDFIEV